MRLVLSRCATIWSNLTRLIPIHSWNNLPRRCKLDSVYTRQYPGWKELNLDRRWRLTMQEYTPLNKEKLPSQLIPRLLLKLYELSPDYYDPQYVKGLHRTLAACRLVCREWSKIVIPKRSWFIIRVGYKEWASCSWYRVRRPPLQSQDGSRTNQESDTVWCAQNYREDLMKSHPKFLPELTENILPGFYKRADNSYGNFRWKDEEKSVIQSTLSACCLVSSEWNRTFTPILYEDIYLGEKNPLLTQSLLHRTLRQTQPAHKALYG